MTRNTVHTVTSQWLLHAVSPSTKWTGLEADHLAAFSTNIINKKKLNRLRWFRHVQRMEENRIPKRVLYMNLGTTRLRGRPRKRWHNDVR